MIIHRIWFGFSMVNQRFYGVIRSFLTLLYVNCLCIFNTLINTLFICLFILQLCFGTNNDSFWFIERINIDKFLVHFELSTILIKKIGDVLFDLFRMIQILICKVNLLFRFSKLNVFLANWTFEILLVNQNKFKRLLKEHSLRNCKDFVIIKNSLRIDPIRVSYLIEWYLRINHWSVPKNFHC